MATETVDEDQRRALLASRATCQLSALLDAIQRESSVAEEEDWKRHAVVSALVERAHVLNNSVLAYVGDDGEPSIPLDEWTALVNSGELPEVAHG